MALCFICKNKNGKIIHIHEQDDPKQKFRNDCLNICVKNDPEVVSVEEINENKFLNKLDQLSIDKKTTEMIKKLFIKRTSKIKK